MDIDPETNRPTRPKSSNLTVASDKTRGILGKCELDLSQYGDGEFNVLTLNLKDTNYEGAYIMVGLKGVPAKKLTPGASPSNAAQSNYSNSDSLIALVEDIERLKKEKNKLKADYEQKMGTQSDKINNLQTLLENTKIDLAYQNKKSKEFQEEAEQHKTESSKLMRTLEAKA